jgi:putative DNA primase/helicase
MHAFTAPVAGSGKSKLVEVASIIATGHEAPVIAPGATEEELEKRLGGALLAGDTVIALDNCDAPLGGVLLCQALTRRR